jgi:peptide/nickel transport system permease protein
MRTYVLRRLIAAAFILVLVSIFVFSMMHLLPGDALLVKLGETGRIPEEQMDELRDEMGIDDPLVVQYVRWIGDLFEGTMGESLIYEGETVSGRIMDALPVTLELGFLAIATALLIGIPLGVLSAVNQDGPLDYFAKIFALLGLSLPQFWIGIVVIIYGTKYLGYVPPQDYVGFFEHPAAHIRQMWIPVLILGYGLSASVIRMTRSTVLEAFHEDYARTARAKGLAERIVVYRHVLRNALIPVITLVGNQTAFVLSGALIIEILFGFPGMGKLALTAIQQRDYTQVQGTALVAGAIIVLVNLIVDLSYGLIDPRVRYS